MKTKLNVLWIAPFPWIKNKSMHPAPWIMTLAQELVNNNINLTLISVLGDINHEIVEKNYNGIGYSGAARPKIYLSGFRKWLKSATLKNDKCF